MAQSGLVTLVTFYAKTRIKTAKYYQPISQALCVSKMELKRLLKFLFIAAPFVVIYFFAFVAFIVALSDSEGPMFHAAVPFFIAAISVAIVTWASGFWGRWKFPVLFVCLPIFVFTDFIFSGAVGIPPMVFTVIICVIYSVLTGKSNAQSKLL